MDTNHDDTARIDCLAMAGDRPVTIPGAAILGLTRVQDGAEIHRVGPALLLTWDGSLVPVVDLSAGMGLPPGDVGNGILVVVRQPAPDGPKALLVASVDDQGDAAGWAEAPVPALLSAYSNAPVVEDDVDSDAGQDAAPDLFLTVGAGGRTYLLALGDIVRIEPFPDGGLQPCGVGLATVLSGRIVRALPLFGCVPGDRPAQALVVVSRGSVQAALVVDSLGDVVEPPARPRLPWGRDGIVEARIVAGSAIGVVDLDHVLGGLAVLGRAA